MSALRVVIDGSRKSLTVDGIELAHVVAEVTVTRSFGGDMVTLQLGPALVQMIPDEDAFGGWGGG